MTEAIIESLRYYTYKSFEEKNVWFRDIGFRDI